MLLEETKAYVEYRLGQLGWVVNTTVDADWGIFEYTGGVRTRINEVCDRLLSIGSLQPKHEINDVTVRLALNELQTIKGMTQDPPQWTDQHENNSSGSDRMSIDQLSAELESKLGLLDRAGYEDHLVSYKVAEPAVQAHALDIPELPQTPARKVAQTKTHLPKILVVDDSAAVRAVIAKSLSNNFTCLHARDGYEACEMLLKDDLIGLALVDLEMPRMDGYELIKRIRSATDPRIREMPVIVVTVTQDVNAKRKALQAGADDFITKNTDPVELVARVHTYYNLALTRAELNRQVRLAEKVENASARRGLINPEIRAPANEVNSSAPKIPSRPKMAVPPRTRKQVVKPVASKGPVKPMVLATEKRKEKTDMDRVTKQDRLKHQIEPRGGPTNSELPPWWSESSLIRMIEKNIGTAITVGATVLVAIGITTIFLASRTDSTANGNKSSAEYTVAKVETQQSAGLDQVISELDTQVSAKPLEQTNVLPSSIAESPTSDSMETRGPSPEPQKKLPLQNEAQPRAPTTAGTSVARSKKPVNTATASRRATKAKVQKDSKPLQISPATTPSSRVSTANPKKKPGLRRERPLVERHISKQETLQVSPGITSVAEKAYEPAIVASARPAQIKVEDVKAVYQAESVGQPVDQSAATGLTRNELDIFLMRFISVYEAGDLEQFIGLFAENARTNDKKTRKGISEDYKELFSTTDLRQMRLGEVHWELSGDEARGWGNFQVMIRNVGENETKKFTGSLTFHIRKHDGRLIISRLYHGQRRMASQIS